MRQYLIGIFVSAILIFLLGYLNVGAQIENFFSAILVAFVLSVLNVMVRPILTIISIPTCSLCAFLLERLCASAVRLFVDAYRRTYFWAYNVFKQCYNGISHLTNCRRLQSLWFLWSFDV